MKALQRKGAWLISSEGRWQMSSVQGPLALENNEREYFRVETTCHEVLLVSRRIGEKGMRELRLDSLLVSKQNHQERISVA